MMAVNSSDDMFSTPTSDLRQCGSMPTQSSDKMYCVQARDDAKFGIEAIGLQNIGYLSKLLDPSLIQKVLW